MEVYSRLKKEWEALPPGRFKTACQAARILLQGEVMQHGPAGGQQINKRKREASLFLSIYESDICQLAYCVQKGKERQKAAHCKAHCFSAIHTTSIYHALLHITILSVMLSCS